MSFMTEAFKPANHIILTKPRKPDNLIKSVQWVDTPGFVKIDKKNSPAQTIGIRYEKRVEKELIALTNLEGFELASHKWIKYNNKFFAQPDFVLISLYGTSILIEVKYTYTDTFDQRELYTKLLKKLGYKSITSCTICHNLTSETPKDKIIHNFRDIKQDSVWQLRI